MLLIPNSFILIVFYSNLSINYFYHGAQPSTLVSMVIIYCKFIDMKKILWPYLNHSIVQGLKILNLASKLMLTSSLKFE